MTAPALPPDPYSITNSEMGDQITNVRDLSNHLVARYERVGSVLTIVVDKMQVAVSDAAVSDFDVDV